jgi:hypothetical protein
LTLYHTTTLAQASQILKTGFVDGAGPYPTESGEKGVWLADRPLYPSDGVYGDTTLAIEVPMEVVADYELLAEKKEYRQYLIPARILEGFPVAPSGQDDIDG